MAIKISKPSPGGNWDKANHVGHLTLFINSTDFTGEYRRGDKDDYLAVPVDFVVCVDCPAAFKDQAITGAVLAPRVDGSEAGVVVGRFGQGESKGGKNPAWLLEDPDASDLAQAESFLAKYATTLPSGAIALDVRAIRVAGKSDDQESF